MLLDTEIAAGAARAQTQRRGTAAHHGDWAMAGAALGRMDGGADNPR